MLSSKPQDADQFGSELKLELYDNIYVVGLSIGIAASVMIGATMGYGLGGYPVLWLGLGIGGAIVGGLGCYLVARSRPHFGLPLACLRFVFLFLIVGIFGYLTARWLGVVGQFLLLGIVPLLVRYVYLFVIGAVRLARGRARFTTESDPPELE
jgi:hypothetical protein